MRLLLAEDEYELNRAVTAILKNSNYAVDSAYDGEEALDYLDSNEYDGVILDIMMPKIDGLEVLRTIRKEKNKVPVLMLTAKSEIDDRVEGLDAGADDYLTKPFNMKELLARVRAITRRKSEITDSILTVGNLTLNRNTFEISVGNESIRLAGKEFQIIEMFMINEGCVISSERLMDKVWGLDSEADVSVVWVYISGLRKKLSSINSDCEIKAVRNQGYSLVTKG
jgi:DNA-binding response OmpR family regulator